MKLAPETPVVAPAELLQDWMAVLIKVDPAAAVDVSDLLDEAARGYLHRVCSHCNTWLGVKSCEGDGRMASKVTHTICEACSNALLREVSA